MVSEKLSSLERVDVVPITISSVLLLFNWKKFAVNHTKIFIFCYFIFLLFNINFAFCFFNYANFPNVVLMKALYCDLSHSFPHM